MQGKTHRVGGVLSALSGFVLLESNNMLIPGVEPILQLAVIYPFAIYGSIVSDLDHNWNSSPSKDPISWVINKILHLSKGRVKNEKSILSIFDAKHRSWQTHSDLFLFIFIILGWFTGMDDTSSINGIIFKLIMIGFVLGVISHLILDSLTSEGIWFILPSIINGKKVTFRLVPKKHFFSTGNRWENLVRSLMWFVIILLFMYILYKTSPYRINIKFS